MERMAFVMSLISGWYISPNFRRWHKFSSGSLANAEECSSKPANLINTTRNIYGDVNYTVDNK